MMYSFFKSVLFLRNFAFCFTIFCVIVASIVPLPIVLFKKSWSIWYSRRALYSIVFFAEVFCGIKWKVEGTENIPKEPFILVAKHSSAWETFFYAFYFNMPVYVFKKILRHIPIFGWYMTATGMMAIERSGGFSTISQMVKKSVDVICNQRRILAIFPQGTRTPYGKGYSLEKYPYKKGIVGIATELKTTPIVCSTHNAVKFFGRNFFSKKKPGTITVRFMPPIKKLETPDSNFLNQVQDLIETETQKLF